ncbi:hypothetical protein SpCBS45565_g00161 [Spizellomyces sp. 'palustris']|nr:hypothetical protein SpCBS45565_g00161 [Spizellomyces sp. 'palustris']
MLTANFSHNELWHMFVNMFVLYSFGPAVIDIIGPRQFIFLYLAAGLASSAASLLHSAMSTRRNAWGTPTRQFTATHGASGAITGCTILFAATYPTVPVYLFMVVPIPAAVAIGGFVAYDVYRSYTGSSGRTDSAAHVGGAAAGLAYWYFKVRGRYRGGRW